MCVGKILNTMNKETRQFIMGLIQFVMGSIGVAIITVNIRYGDWNGDMWSWTILILCSIGVVQGFYKIKKTL